MYGRYPIETSRQDVPVLDPDVERVPLAMSRPLHELKEHAPVTPSEVVLGLVYFPFSNDDSATYYDQVQVRTTLPEYREATNRTAVIVGEGSLMAALPMIAEDTIILVDQSEDMCAYMESYVEALREAETFDEWAEMMELKDGSKVASDAYNAVGAIRTQKLHWYHEDYEHPVDSLDLYDRARKAATKKAIIPWRADLTDESEMRYLGEVLKAHDAHVTFMNLTNALGSEVVAVEAAAERAEILSALPVTPEAPIIATSYIAKYAPSALAQAVGPFFGLKNLGKQGGASIDHFSRQAQAEVARMIGPELLRSLLGGMAAGHGMPARRPNMNIISLGPNGAGIISLDSLPPELRNMLGQDFGA